MTNAFLEPTEGREWPNLQERMLPTLWGSNRNLLITILNASNWATEAGKYRQAWAYSIHPDQTQQNATYGKG